MVTFGLSPPTWGTSWRTFRARHGGWVERVEDAIPIYYIPATVLDTLRAFRVKVGPGGRRTPAPFIAPDDIAAEAGFREMCLAHSRMTIGTLNGVPIEYPLPGLESDSLGTQTSSENGWPVFEFPPVADPALADASPYAFGDCRQMLGYAGRLVFDEQYRAEHAALLACHALLPEPPLFPLYVHELNGVEAMGTVAAGGRPRDDALAEFRRDFVQFARKWQLFGLTTWDLPVPFPILVGAPVSVILRLFGPEHRIDAYPTYYDIPSTLDVRGVIRNGQGTAAREAGIRLEHPVTDTSTRHKTVRRRRRLRGKSAQIVTVTTTSGSLYENAVRLRLIECAVRQRYGDARGLTVQLCQAFARLLKCSERRVKQLREVYGGRAFG